MRLKEKRKVSAQFPVVWRIHRSDPLPMEQKNIESHRGDLTSIDNNNIRRSDLNKTAKHQVPPGGLGRK